MITTTDVLGKGFKFVEGDVVERANAKNDPIDGSEVYWINNGVINPAQVHSFNWRPNTGKMPCDGDLWVEVQFCGIVEGPVIASNCFWGKSKTLVPIEKWRPSMKNWESDDVKSGEDYPANEQLKKVFLPYEDCHLEEIEKPKPKRTKTEYVPVTESIFDLKDELDRGELYQEAPSDLSSNYMQIKTEGGLIICIANQDCYRKVTTEITEREAFIDEGLKISNEINPYTLGKMFDSGKFKLV